MPDSLDAGEFSAWLVEVQQAIAGTAASDVPCGSCTACCTSSQFIHIEPDETDALAHIPAELRFPAPRLPRGHQLMGYDQRGHCPMLIDGACSIYEHRPRTCRTYDCRVFAASGIEVGDDTKALIAERVRRWQFSYASSTAADQHEAVRGAAEFIERHESELDDAPARPLPQISTQRAALAIELHGLFLAPNPPPTVPSVRVELGRITGRAAP